MQISCKYYRLDKIFNIPMYCTSIFLCFFTRDKAQKYTYNYTYNTGWKTPENGRKDKKRPLRGRSVNY